jgi:chemotaxis protein histidine kinase CheA
VVAHKVLEQGGCDIERLLTLRSMRPASEYEAGKDHVDLQSPELHLSYEHMLAEKDRQIARLQSRVSTLEEQLSAGSHLAATAGVAVADQQQAALIEQKDRALRDLEARIQVAEQRMMAAEAEAKVAKEARAARASLLADEAPKAEAPKAEAAKPEPKAKAAKPDAKAAPEAPPEPPAAPDGRAASQIRRVA